MLNFLGQGQVCMNNGWIGRKDGKNGRGLKDEILAAVSGRFPNCQIFTLYVIPSIKWGLDITLTGLCFVVIQQGIPILVFLICYLCSKLYWEVFSRGLNAPSGDMKKVNECLTKFSHYVKDIYKSAKEMYGLKCSII